MRFAALKGQANTPQPFQGCAGRRTIQRLAALRRSPNGTLCCLARHFSAGDIAKTDLRRQPFNLPLAIIELVAEAVVQTALATLPEFDPFRDDDVTAPGIGRKWHVVFSIRVGCGRDLTLQGLAIGKRLRLR